MERARFDGSTILHTAVIVLVVVCATVLRARNELDTATVATVYGAALGFAPRLGAKVSGNGTN